MTVLKWTIFFKNQSFEHDNIIYNFVALSISLCLYHRDLTIEEEGGVNNVVYN